MSRHPGQKCVWLSNLGGAMAAWPNPCPGLVWLGLVWVPGPTAEGLDYFACGPDCILFTTLQAQVLQIFCFFSWYTHLDTHIHTQTRPDQSRPGQTRPEQTSIFLNMLAYVVIFFARFCTFLNMFAYFWICLHMLWYSLQDFTYFWIFWNMFAYVVILFSRFCIHLNMFVYFWICLHMLWDSLQDFAYVWIFVLNMFVYFAPRALFPRILQGLESISCYFWHPNDWFSRNL